MFQGKNLKNEFSGVRSVFSWGGSFNFLTAWTISIKFGTLVQHAPGNKRCLRFFNCSRAT